MIRWARSWLVCGVLGGAACSAPGAEQWPVRVEVDRVVDRSTLDHALTPEEVQRVVSAQLDQSPLFTVGPGDAEPRKAEVWLAVVRDGHGTRVLDLHLKMQPPRPLERTLRSGLSARVVVEPGAGAMDPAKDLPFAAERAVAVLEARVLLAEGRPESVMQVLQVEDPEILTEALDWVRDNRMRAAAERVAALLDHPDERVSRAAVEALGVVGDRTDVPRMLKEVRLGDRGHTHRLYEALARLGGREAQAFLEFAARNEDDPSLAVAAAQALHRVRSGDPEPEVASDGPDGRIPRGHR